MLSETAQKVDRIEEKHEQVLMTYTQIRMFERVFMRCLHLMKMSGLPEDWGKAISEVTRLIWSVRMLTMSMHALSAATGPLGWLNAILGITTGIVMASDVMIEVRASIPGPPLIPP